MIEFIKFVKSEIDNKFGNTHNISARGVPCDRRSNMFDHDSYAYDLVCETLSKSIRALDDFHIRALSVYYLHALVSDILRGDSKLDFNVFTQFDEMSMGFSSMPILGFSQHTDNNNINLLDIMSAMNEYFGTSFVVDEEEDMEPDEIDDANREYLSKIGSTKIKAVQDFYYSRVEPLKSIVQTKSNNNMVLVFTSERELYHGYKQFVIDELSIMPVPPNKGRVHSDDLLDCIYRNDILRFTRSSDKPTIHTNASQSFTGKNQYCIVFDVNKYGVCTINHFIANTASHGIKLPSRTDIDGDEFARIQDQLEDTGGLLRIDDTWEIYLGKSDFFIESDAPNCYWDPINSSWVLAANHYVVSLDGFKVDTESYKQLTGTNPSDFVDKDFVTKKHFLSTRLHRKHQRCSRRYTKTRRS